MADSGYYVGDKATGTPLESLGGGGGGVTATQLASNGVIQNQEVVITHPADVDGKRIVNVTEFISGSGQTNTDLDFDLADEGQFTQEDGVTGTDFVNGVVARYNSVTPEYTTLDPLKIGSNLTLTNANTTVTSDVSGLKMVLSEALMPATGGYVEITVDVKTGVTTIGLANSSVNVNSWLGGDAFGWGYYGDNGSIYHSGGSTGYGAGFVQGDVVGLAYKSGKMWVSINGVWQNGGNPATDTNGYSGITGDVYVALEVRNVGDAFTANFGGTAFTYPVPSGFESGINGATPIYSTGSSYISTTDTNHILLDNVQSIDSTTITVSTPTNTTVNGLVSFDGRTTWEKYQSGSWTSLGSIDLSTYDWTNTNSDVSFLLQSDTTNGSTTIVDSSLANVPMTLNGGLIHSTTEQKFGTSSLLFNGSDSTISITANDSFDFGTDDFTIDFWINPSSLQTTRGLISHRSGGNGNCWALIFHDTNNVINLHSGIAQIFDNSSVPALPINTWSHVAVTRAGTTMSLYIDGVFVKSVTNSLDFTSAIPTYIGHDPLGLSVFDGYMDEIRITKGTALWTGTGSFTPPTSAAVVTVNSNSASAIETGLSSLTITDETSLDFAFDIGTTDSSVSPSIDQITLNYTEGGLYKQTAPTTEYSATFTSDTTTTVKKLSAGTNNIKINVIQ